jgi:hypothetical protein
MFVITPIDSSCVLLAFEKNLRSTLWSVFIQPTDVLSLQNPQCYRMSMRSLCKPASRLFSEKTSRQWNQDYLNVVAGKQFSVHIIINTTLNEVKTYIVVRLIQVTSGYCVLMHIISHFVSDN